jgi:8-oxo-dGTP pyrophosphatase MutT (NUDIX family)
VNRIWGLFLTIVFHCARVVFTVTRIKLRGALVAVWSENKMLLIQKSYRKAWSIPGGLVKKHETRQQGAVREVFEEVGLRLDPDGLTFIAQVPGELGPNDRAHLFEIKIDDPVDVVIDGREIVKAEFVLPEEAVYRLLDKQIEGYVNASVRQRLRKFKFMGQS